MTDEQAALSIVNTFKMDTKYSDDTVIGGDGGDRLVRAIIIERILLWCRHQANGVKL